MNQIPSICPICGGQMTITRLYCQACDTTIEGRFVERSLAQLSTEDLDFIETFVRCEGKINRMEKELNLSYPTIRNRLNEVIRHMGYEPSGEEEAQELPEESRADILEALETGRISVDQALEMLQGKEE